jgi:acetylornithine deacetylase
MKGALAACIGAAKALRDAGRPLAGDVVVAAVADEEYGSLGTSELVARMPVDGAIVTEPTHLRVCLAHKGFVWLRVRTKGRAAHGSRFDEGVDANMMMGRVLSELAELENGLRAGPAHPLVGPPSLHAALIRGGSGISTYAAACELEIERRTIPGETVDQVESEVSSILDRLRATDASFSATHEILVSRDPFEVAPEARIVRVVEQAARSLLGREPERVGDTPWMDSALLAAAGVDTVVIGPAGGGAHSKVEWVDLKSVVDLASILAEAALEYCA